MFLKNESAWFVVELCIFNKYLGSNELVDEQQELESQHEHMLMCSRIICIRQWFD